WARCPFSGRRDACRSGIAGRRRPGGRAPPRRHERIRSRTSRIPRRRLTTRRASPSMTAMRIVVMGSGGTGGYFGAKLARGGDDVTFVARGAHLAALRANGLRVKSAGEGGWTGRAPAVERLDSLPPPAPGL